MTPAGFSRKVIGWPNVGNNFFAGVTQNAMQFQLMRGLLTSFVNRADKVKSPGSGTGGDGHVDQDGYSLDLDTKAQQKLEQLKHVIEKNTYYDKYKAKIIETQKVSPKTFLGIIEQLVSAGKKATGFEARKMHVPSKNSLNEVMKLEMLLKVDRDDIVFIWQEYHHGLNMLAATMTSQVYDRICTRGKSFSTFVLPLPKKNGHQMFLVQYYGGSFYFTPLIKYQLHKENAPVCLSLLHYTELRENKDLILMRGEWDKETISLTEAQFLTVQLNLYYGEGNETRLDMLKVFNETSPLFEHMAVIEELGRMRTEHPHLFPELN